MIEIILWGIASGIGLALAICAFVLTLALIAAATSWVAKKLD